MLYIIIVFITLSFSGCEDIIQSNSNQSDQEIFFQYEYINYAWSYQHAGWLIDASGKVYTYHLPENWNFPDSTGYIDATAMEANISATDSVCSLIDKSELNDKIRLIENAAAGVLTEPEYVAADAGAMTYYAFIYEKRKDRYRRILLKENGDAEISNTSKAADDLYVWMEGFQLELGF